MSKAGTLPQVSFAGFALGQGGLYDLTISVSTAVKWTHKTLAARSSSQVGPDPWHACSRRAWITVVSVDLDLRLAQSRLSANSR